jgi:two-component system phosphate regulon sensor histidine kinase PhoR
VSARLSRAGEAVSLYTQVLALPSSVADDQHVPLAYYAAERLLELRAGASAVSERLMADIDGGRLESFGPAAAYKLRSLLQAVRGGDDAPPGPNHAVDIVSRRIQAVERAMALQRDFQATLASRLLSQPERTPESVWLTYGGGRPWFVTVSTTADADPVLVAIDAEAAFAAVCTGRSAGAQLVGRTTSAGSDDQPLGPRFPDVAVRLAARSDAADPTWRTARNFYASALSLVLGITAVGGYLLWRDVRREVRLAETRSQFVASVSHELKTPLTSIRMFAETLLMRDAATPGDRGLGPADRAEYLETIVNESERLTRLLNNVLDFSRIDRGEKAYQLKPASLTAVVRTAARSAAYTASLRNVDIVVDVPDGPCEAPIDADAIQQAVLNLLTNAIKYAGDARKVALSLTCSDGRATVAVRDWGIGIPRRDHARIFERFYRVASEDNRSIPGTGLGLALVAHAVDGHGGRIEIESEPGRGSTFTIHLPTEPLP